MTTATGDSVAATGADTFAKDWRALRADGDIQFTPLQPPKPPETPEWLKAIGRFLDSLLTPVGRFVEWLLSPLTNLFRALGQFLGVSATVLMWVFGALVVTLVGVLVWRYVASLERRERPEREAEPDWVPATGDALALLEDADRLAAEGRFDEATHLLLKRSVGQIAAARPDLLEPSSTAREIAELPALSEAARGAFVLIAGRVERSLFALRSLSADDWNAARAAYADFALAAGRNALA